jgi:hypothetical protein
MGRDPTHPLLKEWGKATGMSPVRTGYALEQMLTGTNPFLLLPVQMYRVAAGATGSKQNEMVWQDILARTPVLSRFLHTTSPYTAYGDQTAQYAQDVNSKSLIQRRGLDDISEIYFNNPSKESRQVIRDYIRQQPAEDRKGLLDRFNFNKQVFNYPDRDWWLHTYSLPAEAKAQAFMDKYQSLAGDDQAQKDLLHHAYRLKGYAGSKFRLFLHRLRFPKTERGEASGG